MRITVKIEGWDGCDLHMVVKTIGVQDALVDVAKYIAILQASLLTSDEMEVLTFTSRLHVLMTD